MNVLRHIGSRTFQSTLPLRGATPSNAVNNASSDFNPHSPCGERRVWVVAIVTGKEFQSTLPLRGATRPDNWTIWPTGYFNPHSPCGERRGYARHQRHPRHFNPHSPCGERRGHARHQRHPRHFNPHSPCGERQEDLENFRQLLDFQSTLPLRGATGHCHTLLSGHAISIHTPLAGSDLEWCQVCRVLAISIHTPLAGSDDRSAILIVPPCLFQSTLPLRGATLIVR